MSEEIQLIIAALGALKGSEWIFKYLYAKRRDRKYSDRMTSELKFKLGEMEINLINQIGQRLDNKWKEQIEKIQSRLEYVERQINNLHLSHASIQNVVEELKQYFNKEIEKIETQYRIILEAIRGRAKKG